MGLGESKQFGFCAPGAQKPWHTFLRQLKKRMSGAVGLVLVLAFVLVAIFASLLAPFDPLAQDLNKRLYPPVWQTGGSSAHLLGTDPLGRDLLSRMIFGSQISLFVGIATVAIGSTLGVLAGLIAGYRGGVWDNLIMRAIDLQLAFPSLILAIAVMALLGPGLRNTILVLSITNWVLYARIVRGETLSLRSREFVEAARVIGVSEWRILVRHILPNVVSVVTVVATFSVAQVVLAEASLSFLGIGVPPPTPTWGGMLSEGRDYVSTAWWISTLPGLAIMLALMGINLFGDWLRDVLDPRLANL